MGCFSCFKSPPSVDPFEEEYDLALQVSRHEANVQEAEQLALAMEESSREEEEEKKRTKMIEEEERRRTRAIEEERKRTRAIEEERRRTKMVEEERRRTRAIEEERRRTRILEEDAQIANGFLYEDRERQINHNSTLEYEQIAKAIAKSLKEKGKRKQFEEQVKNDEQIAQDLQNHFSNMSYEESARLHDNSVLDDEDEQFVKAVAKSLEEKGKGKQLEKDESLKMVEPPPRAPTDEDEQRIIWESLKGKSQITEFTDEVEENGNLVKENPPPSMYGGCTKMVEEERRRTRSLEEERRRTKMIEEERRRTRMMEEDAQIANGFLYEDRERQINNNAALEEEQIDMAIKESLKVKGKGKQFEDEQVKNNEKIAAIYQDSLNNMVDSPPRLTEIKNISATAPLDEDEQLEKVIRESLKGKGLIGQPKDDELEDDGNLPMVNTPRSMCGGCNSEIERGRSVDVLGVLWHPECLWCDACDKSIAIHELETHVSNSRGRYHKSCYERYCYVCKEKKLKAYHEHHFWKERYCPAHDTDGTHKCCSCERLEPRGTNYVMLGDRRQLCLECMDSAVMDTYEVQPLHFEIREYFGGLNMKIEKEFPFFLVEKQALNEAEKEEKIDNHYELVTRGICLSEAQTVTSVSKGPRMLPNKQLTGMATESQRVVRECEVTAILILYGLPRLLTGYILAHEMMHAYLRLNGHRIVNDVMEEGICQVVGHMWLEAQRYAPIDTTEAAGASSSSTPPVAASESKKGECSDFEKKLVEFFMNQIEEDDSPVYGLGFKKVFKMVSNSSLPETLKKIIRRG